MMKLLALNISPSAAGLCLIIENLNKAPVFLLSMPDKDHLARPSKPLWFDGHGRYANQHQQHDEIHVGLEKQVAKPRRRPRPKLGRLSIAENLHKAPVFLMSLPDKDHQVSKPRRKHSKQKNGLYVTSYCTTSSNLSLHIISMNRHNSRLAQVHLLNGRPHSLLSPHAQWAPKSCWIRTWIFKLKQTSYLFLDI